LNGSSGGSGIERWEITKIARSASQSIEGLDSYLQEKIIQRLEELQNNPFLGDIQKIKGKADIYRLRIGDYRLYYRLFPNEGVIEILLFERRGKIKKKKIERFK
jgi:mRNA interferase RelE/StbE